MITKNTSESTKFGQLITCDNNKIRSHFFTSESTYRVKITCDNKKIRSHFLQVKAQNLAKQSDKKIQVTLFISNRINSNQNNYQLLTQKSG